MIRVEFLPFTNKQTRTIKYTCDTGYMYMDLSFLVYFPLSNLKIYLILEFVMLFHCSKSIKVIQFTENVHTQKYFFISNLPKDFQYVLRQWNLIFNFLEQ